MDPDDDDRMSANPEEPIDIGQRRRRRNAESEEGHWRPEWVPGKPAAAAAIAKLCRKCSTRAATHQDPSSDNHERTICGVCQGVINRERIGWGSGGQP